MSREGDYDAGPQGMYDMTGWTPVDCADSDRLRASRQVTVVSSLTDPRANYSSGVTFTEWWADGRPLLRDYLYPSERPCEHYAWTHPTETEGDSDV